MEDPCFLKIVFLGPWSHIVHHILVKVDTHFFLRSVFLGRQSEGKPEPEVTHVSAKKENDTFLFNQTAYLHE